MMEETTAGTNLSRRAVLLMGEIMHLANRLLPSQMAAHIQVRVCSTVLPRALSIRPVGRAGLRAGVGPDLCHTSDRRHECTVILGQFQSASNAAGSFLRKACSLKVCSAVMMDRLYSD
jgi:hypothetical protein